MASAGEAPAQPAKDAGWARVAEDDRAIKVETDKLEAVIPKKEPKQWMTGIEKGSFLDKSTGFREVGDGLMVVDWLMEPGSDAAWSDKVIAPDGHGVGRYTWFTNENDPVRRSYAMMAHGSSHRKRMVEGPQLCHRMKPVRPEVIRGEGFVAVKTTYEAWCSQRPGGIIVMIEEVHGRPVKAGTSFNAAHIVGYFDTIEEMHAVYDRYKGHTALSADTSGWRLEK